MPPVCHVPADVAPPRGVRWGFTGRAGGVSSGDLASLTVSPASGMKPGALEENVRRAVASVDARADACRAVFMEQVHGGEVALARGPAGPRDPIPGVDGVWTDVGDLVLAVRVADCVPVLLATEHGVGAAHAGWRGVVDGVVPRTVEAMVAGVGCSAAAVRAVVGPCIGMSAFEVGPEVVEALARVVPGWDERHVRGGRADRSHVDLRAAVVAQLRACGVGAVGHVLADTTDADWFSWRGDGPRTGRQAGWVSWRP